MNANIIKSRDDLLVSEMDFMITKRRVHANLVWKTREVCSSKGEYKYPDRWLCVLVAETQVQISLGVAGLDPRESMAEECSVSLSSGWNAPFQELGLGSHNYKSTNCIFEEARWSAGRSALPIIAFLQKMTASIASDATVVIYMQIMEMHLFVGVLYPAQQAHR